MHVSHLESNEACPDLSCASFSSAVTVAYKAVQIIVLCDLEVCHLASQMFQLTLWHQCCTFHALQPQQFECVASVSLCHPHFRVGALLQVVTSLLSNHTSVVLEPDLYSF